MTDDPLIAEAVHDTGVRRLQHAYADVVNRRAWPELEALFRPDAEVVIDRRAGEPLRLVGGSEVGAFIGTAIARFSFFEFVILNAHIVFPDGPGAGTAVCRLFMCELRQDGRRRAVQHRLRPLPRPLRPGGPVGGGSPSAATTRSPVTAGCSTCSRCPTDPGIEVPGAGG